jgi:hypothetical protein
MRRFHIPDNANYQIKIFKKGFVNPITYYCMSYDLADHYITLYDKEDYKGYIMNIFKGKDDLLVLEQLKECTN